MCADMNRRDFMRLSAVAGAMAAMPLRAQEAWRSFEVTHRIELGEVKGPGAALAWLPMAIRSTPYQRELSRSITGNHDDTRAWALNPETEVLAITWRKPIKPPVFELKAWVETKGHRVALDGKAPAPSAPKDLDRYLKPTKLIPTDGIVRDTALKITRGKTLPLARARAIYDWIVENTARDSDVRGCGLGDIKGMLETGNLTGKCADINALFVGLCRAVALPARDLYGIRLAASEIFPSLGRAGENVSTAQHCRAEVYLDRIGWVPVDPADVRKVILEEHPQTALADPSVQRARAQLFGSWEMNWMAYNDAHDVTLPGSTGKMLPFLMYPQAEVNGARRDDLDPDHFRYTITAREVK